ncbi:glycosyltransferase [Vibrio breoganii]|uniref:glycosyltransferase n=1 Tax=Vibrio breoganii TaxID=553239 RepID=UPI000C826BC3|nr:glycosyltransferase [Vibrio breoganii]PMO79409.1 hypothetical protein BCT00_01070 [Vibrio breoganii]
MNILICIHSLSGGGAEKQVHLIAGGLSRLNHTVTVLYHENGPKGDELEFVDSKVNYIKIPYGHKNPLLIPFLFKYAKKSDIVISWILQMDVLFGFLKQFINFKWLFREPNSDYANNTLKYKLRHFFAKKASGIIANSAAGMQLWEDFLCPKKVIYNVAYQGNLLQNTNNKEINFAYVGRFIEQKNVMRLSQVFNLVSKKLPVKCDFYGKGSDCPVIEWSSSVINNGFISKPDDVFKKVKFFISLSKREGNPNSVLEAMLEGCLLVLSDIPTHREIFSGAPNSNVLFVNLMDSNEVIAANIIDFYSRVELVNNVDWSPYLSGRENNQVVNEYNNFIIQVSRGDGE